MLRNPFLLLSPTSNARGRISTSEGKETNASTASDFNKFAVVVKPKDSSVDTLDIHLKGIFVLHGENSKMNSLNIISARVSPPQTPVPSRSNSYGNALSLAGATDTRKASRDNVENEKDHEANEPPTRSPNIDGSLKDPDMAIDEKASLLGNNPDAIEAKTSRAYSIPHRIASAVIASLRWVMSSLTAPGVYLLACLYDEKGQFTLISPIYKFWPRRKSGLASAQALGTSSSGESVPLTGNHNGKDASSRRTSAKTPRRPITTSSSSGLSSESESDRDRPVNEADDEESNPPARHTRSKSSQSSDEIAPARRSIRIKLHTDDSVRQRKHRKAQSTSSQSILSGAVPAGEISPATLKSPTSPAASLSMTKYPRAPAPPRPLIPRRQPSYTLPDGSGRLAQKTLILDLDETLIHSMAKGGRMSTGHMVEVKLNTFIGVAGQTSIGPQHPILYYVHKRPYCDEFLRRICKWYNLVIFTASVQEYADPVIDWLEQERKFFSGRLYRQHCTYRNGAFIKDLSSVEPDLSKVMILDNSPLSYMFHQDNAIPIEGWINDPTDNDLLHLVPLLEGLQYVTDVRALLALRGGEDGKHMVA